MSPDQLRIQELERQAVDPVITDLGLGAVVSKTGAGDTTDVLKAVNEAGSTSYNVAEEYAGTITVKDTSGTSYKLGYYAP